MQVLDPPCLQLAGVGPKIAEKLTKIGIHHASDLLFHLPLRYEDRSRLHDVVDLSPGQRAQVDVTVISTQMIPGRRAQLICHTADTTGKLALRFFHFTAQQKKGLAPGVMLRCFGEVRFGRYGLEMAHPEYQRMESFIPVDHDARLTPVYPATEGLNQRLLRKLVKQAITLCDANGLYQDLLPAPIKTQYKLPMLRSALLYVHQPPIDADQVLLQDGVHPMQQRLALEELLAHRLALQRLREAIQHHRATPYPRPEKLLKQFLKQFGFTLTKAQERVAQEIQTDIAKPFPMLRLVQGDVGSGKTVVAAIAALSAVAAGDQAALMAPTEILAEQHYRNFSAWAKPLGITVTYLSAQLKAKPRRDALAAMANGDAQIVVGTHVLFQKEVTFKTLGLVIVDEQHRFGVHQRLQLREKGVDKSQCPHQLIMTATPIPRTLAMSAYADLDYSVIDELPPGRQPVQTLVLPVEKRDEIMQRISHVCEEGRQVYWVCPLIEESDALQCQAAEECEQLLRVALPHLKIGLVHGRMKGEDKEAIMQAFKQGKIHVLVATTVIEVGVDVPNASLMVIENAERMGLAQLHQLRGRVGRGSYQSYCVLLYKAPLSPEGQTRLSTLRRTSDGFEVAEADLELRGPGEVLGTRQTGVAMMRIANIMRDKSLLSKAATLAKAVRQSHPDIIDPLIERWIGDRKDYKIV